MTVQIMSVYMGSCIDGVNDFTCQCDTGYAGDFCDENMNDCNHQHCVHGTCIDGVSDFTCQCEVGYAGDLCAQNIDDW